MNRHTLLTRYLASLAAGLAGCADPPVQPPTAAELCSGDVQYYQTRWVELQPGYVPVAPGAACPDVPELTAIDSVGCCPFLEAVAVCGFTHVEADMAPVSGRGWAPADADTPSASRADLCWYDTAFVSTDVCCGRPLVEEGKARVAPAVVRDDWCSEACAPARASPEDRACAAAFWRAAALAEHASIASFAVFSLDLLRLGAPPDLVARAHAAALDEIQHAQLCFSLATAFGDVDTGPGLLPLGPWTPSAPDDFARALVRDGCVGETLAAIDAAARLGLALDPSVRAALETIQADEARHAELAWETLDWLLAVRPALAPGVAAAFAEAGAVWLSDGPPDPSSGVAALGVLSEPRRRAVIAAGWRAVIAPVIGTPAAA